jgi:RNA polymerase sigma-70 factor (ECF subfamily)
MQTTDFHGLYEAHARDVHRFALFLTGNAAEADDVTAEVFLRAWTGRDRIRHATARAYLLAIARNLARDGRRRGRREGELTGEFVAGGAAPDERVDFEQTLDALRALPEDLREPLSLHVFGGLPYEEIARELGVPLPTVKIRIYRARVRLAERMQRTKEAKR